MKKLLALCSLILMCANAFAQQVVLVFTGKDVTNDAYVQLSRIEITDLTQGWTETLFYPDTLAILTVGSGTSVEDYVNNEGLCLSQNSPNPFFGATDVNLNLTEVGVVTLDVTDVNGRVVAAQNFAGLQPGCCQFRVNVSDAGVYFLTVRQNGKTSSVKMVNNGNGRGNGIEYVGSASQSLQAKNDAKGNINRAFAYGDEMTYKGYVEDNGVEIEGDIKIQTQILSEIIVLTVHLPFHCGTSTVTDVDGNLYHTIQMGNQCWMKENLRATKYPDNTSITYYSDVVDDQIYTDPGTYRNPLGSIGPNSVSTYGYLYNYDAVAHNSSSNNYNQNGRLQGVCPTDWHVPTRTEWMQLTDYVSSQNQYWCGSSNNIARALASTTGWNRDYRNCTVGYIPSENNATGFSAQPAGYNRNGTAYGFGDVGYFGYVSGDNVVGAVMLGYQYAWVTYSSVEVCSVRCVHN